MTEPRDLHRRRYAPAPGVCGLEIDNQLERGRLQDGQVSGLVALEDLAGVNADLAAGMVPDPHLDRGRPTDPLQL